MNRAVAALALLVACADRTPPPTTVSLALPLPAPSATTAQIEAHDTKPALDDGDFSSERGMVHLTAEPDGTLAGTYAGGILTCKNERDLLACRWYQGTSEGRATLRRKPDGRVEGTWGNGPSDDDGGSWTLVPVARAAPLEGVWDTNWGVATVRATARGGVHVDYPDGTMDCEQRDRKLTCAWNESSLSGNAELTIESSRLLRGRWGSGASATDGGPWVFVKR